MSLSRALYRVNAQPNDVFIVTIYPGVEAVMCADFDRALPGALHSPALVKTLPFRAARIERRRWGQIRDLKGEAVVFAYNVSITELSAIANKVP
jgi:hypothetical protein